MEEEGDGGEKLKEKLSASQHLLVDKEMEKGRHKVFNFLKSTLLLGLFFEILRLVNIDISTPMKTTLCLKDPTY